jgi:hypothetical protein
MAPRDFVTGARKTCFFGAACLLWGLVLTCALDGRTFKVGIRAEL